VEGWKNGWVGRLEVGGAEGGAGFLELQAGGDIMKGGLISIVPNNIAEGAAMELDDLGELRYESEASPVWDEYKYRHDLIWRHLIRSTVAITEEWKGGRLKPTMDRGRWTICMAALSRMR
jgi:hypothetical protein